MDLDLFARLVDQRDAAWQAAGITSEFHRGRPTDKPAAWVDCETPWSMAQLIVWTSGEAEMIWNYVEGGAEPVSDHYEVTSEIALIDCLDDLTAHLLARP